MPSTFSKISLPIALCRRGFNRDLLLFHDRAGVSKSGDHQRLHLVRQERRQAILLGFVKARLVEVIHVQSGDKQLLEAEIGDDLQRPIGHGAGIENAAADILAKAEHAALGGKDHAVFPAVVIPQRAAVDPGR